MPKKKFWQFRAAANDDKTGELLLYGEISDSTWWGDEVTPKQFRQDMDALGDVSAINVFINSSGGDVFASQAIHTMLKRHQAKINVYVDGLAASGASLVAMAGDTIIMPKNAMMMVHNPWYIAIGDAADMRNAADMLDRVREAMIPVYQIKTGLKTEEIITIMDAETWMTAEEAVELGFADEIEETKAVAASLSGRVLTINGQEFDLSRYRNPPKLAFAPSDSLPDDQIAKSPDVVIDNPVLNEGRILSGANEQKLTQAKDLLNEVLDQVSKENSPGENSARGAPPQGSGEDPPPQNKTAPPEAEQTDTGLLSLHQRQSKINQNRRKGHETT